MSSSGREQATAAASHVCAGCGATLEVEARHRGRRLCCSRCGTEFTAPAADAAALRARPCPACGASLAVRPELEGRRVRCPRCETVFTLGGERAAPVTTPAPSPQPSLAPDPAAEGGASTMAPPGSGRPGGPSTAATAHAGGGALPSSYTHTCTACGARLQVHARYYGRSLRCTSCGEEFAASPPPFVPLAPATGPASGPGAHLGSGGRRRWWRRLAVGAVVAAACAAGAWWLGSVHEAGVGSELFAAARGRGDLGQVRGPDGGPAVAALDRDTVVELVAALDSGDQARLAALRSSAHCLELEAGTRVRVLDGVRGARPTRVRVLSGPWSSRVVWVPATYIR